MRAEQVGLEGWMREEGGWEGRVCMELGRQVEAGVAVASGRW